MKKRAKRYIVFIFSCFVVFQFHSELLFADDPPGWCIKPYPPPAPPPGPPPPPCCGGCGEQKCTGSPVYIATGNYSLKAEDLSIPTRGLPLSINRTYDSIRVVDGLMGNGWTSNLTTRLYYARFLAEAPSTFVNEAVILMPDGKSHRFVENPDGITFTPPIGIHNTLIRAIDSSYVLQLELSRKQYRFMIDGRLDYIVDEFGNTLDYQYDAQGKLDKIVDQSGSGRFLDITIGANGRISDINDSSGRNVHFNYTNGNLDAVNDPLRSTSYPNGRKTRYSYVTGRFGQLMTAILKDKPVTGSWTLSLMTYDSIDRLLTYTEGQNPDIPSSEDYEKYTYTYQPGGDITKTEKRNRAGDLWIFTYNNLGLVTRVDYPAGGGSKQFTYYSDTSYDTVTDETGIKTKYIFDQNTGALLSVTQDYQGTSAVRFDYTYDPAFPGKVTSIKPVNPSTGTRDPDWQWWRYDYYQTGSTAPSALFHTYRVSNDGTETGQNQQTIATYQYNSNGQVTSAKDGTNAETIYTYDAEGDLQTITYPKNSDTGPNPVYQYGTDAIGRVTSVTDPLGKTTTYTFDELSRILTLTLPKPSTGSSLNFVTTYSYDNFNSGLLFTDQTDPNGRITKQGYNEFDQVVQTRDAYNKITTFAYKKDLLISITDANDYTTSYSYNALRRLADTTFADGKVEQYTYYADGLLQTKTDRLQPGQQISFTYDPFKRLRIRTYAVGSITYNYIGQKLTSVTDTFSGDNHSFTYDSFYRFSSDQGSLSTLNYSSYDGADRILQMSVTGGPTTGYTYYADGSLKTITWSRVGGQFLYTYTLNSQYNTITFPNGQRRDYSYDDQRRLLQIANTGPSSQNLGTYVYEYDYNYYLNSYTMLGQRSKMTATIPHQGFNNSVFKFYYDNNYQLKQADYPAVAPYNGVVESWNYDDVGNRTSSTAGGNTQNYTYQTITPNPKNWQRLLSDGVKNYSYDHNGSLIADGTLTYAWDYDNRLKGITQLNTTYKYDYIGRRIGKTVGASTTNYIYQGQNLIAEGGASIADYVSGPGIDEPLAMYRNSLVYYYDVDGLGSVNLINSATGTVQNSYIHDVWGKLRSSSTPVSNLFGYTAREFSEAGLLYYRARYYNPGIGRFISEDPIGSIPPGSSRIFTSMEFRIIDPSIRSDVAKNQANIPKATARISRGFKPPDTYLYVRNKPIYLLDPSGLQASQSNSTTIQCTPNDPCLGLPPCDCDWFCGDKSFCTSTAKKWNCEYWSCICYHSGVYCGGICNLGHGCDFGPRGFPTWEKPGGPAGACQ